MINIYYSYTELDKILKEKGKKRITLSKELGISSRTLAKISKGEKIADNVLKKIADYLQCSPEIICQMKSENNLLQIIREEKKAKIAGGIYHELQIRMTYNSNHIEGSKLNEEQTRQIFETKTLIADGILSTDDIIETTNHFRAIDYVIDIAEETLTEEMIKTLHKILKSNTSDSDISWFAVGDYKKRPNTVAGKETTKPSEVQEKIQNLVKEYTSIKDTTIEDIIEFHYNFETIHPFQDGNGRVGRLIAFKECLKNKIVPFVIEDIKKAY